MIVILVMMLVVYADSCTGVESADACECGDEDNEDDDGDMDDDVNADEDVAADTYMTADNDAYHLNKNDADDCGDDDDDEDDDDEVTVNTDAYISETTVVTYNGISIDTPYYQHTYYILSDEYGWCD